MGHRAGWLALGSGIAGGADVILIPEIPYQVETIADAIRRRSQHGTNFSIVAVAEGAVSAADAKGFAAAQNRKKKAKSAAETEQARRTLAKLSARHAGNTWRLSKQLEALTDLEARVTILGYVQRGGTPSATDRLLATQLGTKCVELLEQECFGMMVAIQGGVTVPVPLVDVAGKIKLIPPDHAWVQSARRVGTCLGA